jgi:peptidoglycan/xylan/chitin deacetylase (PgdA/CDA1 family)
MTSIEVRAKKIPILMYHSVSHTTNPKIAQWTIRPELFAEQIAYLHQHAYTPMTVTQFVRARAQTATVLPSSPIVLTFDDGFADFFTAVLPILKLYDFTATLYVPTAFVGGTSRWLYHEGETTRPMLTWAQLAEISASHIECGSHSHSHPQLDILPCAIAKDEIVRSKNLLEDHLGQKVSSFSYPFGYHSNAIRRLVQETGYTSACSVKYMMSSEDDDPFSLARLGVGADTTLTEFAALLTDPASQPNSAAYKMYTRTRTLAWRLVRRYAVR